MDIAALIERVDPGPLHYEGVFYTSGVSLGPRGCEATIEFLRTDDALLVEGHFAESGSSLRYPLAFAIPFSSLTSYAGEGRLQLGSVGVFPGSFVTNGDGFMFIGRVEETTVTFHLEAKLKRPLSLAGMVQFARRAMAFYVTPAAEWRTRAAAKVVSLHSALSRGRGAA